MKLVTQCHRVLNSARAFTSVALRRGVLKHFTKHDLEGGLTHIFPLSEFRVLYGLGFYDEGIVTFRSGVILEAPIAGVQT